MAPHTYSTGSPQVKGVRRRTGGPLATTRVAGRGDREKAHGTAGYNARMPQVAALAFSTRASRAEREHGQAACNRTVLASVLTRER